MSDSTSSNATPSKSAAQTNKAVTQAPAKKRQAAPQKSAPQKASAKTNASAPKPVAKPAKPVNTAPQAGKTKALKEKKVKVVRDSFTIPKAEFGQITDMKKRAIALGVDIKKSELIRAGLQALFAMSDAGFKKALAAVPTLKTGRPSKD